MFVRRTFIFAVSLIAISCAVSNPNTKTTTPLANAAATSTPATPTVSTVNIRSADGLVLGGIFLPAAQPNSPALLLLHQWQSDRHSYDDFAKRMQAKGFNVLAVDGRGFGESTKSTDGKTVQAERTAAAVQSMLSDVDAAMKFLADQPNVDRSKIGIVGASYGSSLALIYAADHPNIASVALLSPGLNYFGNMPTEPAIKKYGDRPMFLVAAEDDKESADAVNKLLSAGNNTGYGANIYPSGGHGTALFKLKFPGDLEYRELGNLLESFFTTRMGTPRAERRP